MADLPQPLLLLLGGQAGQVVGLGVVEALDVASHRLGQRRPGQELRPRRRAFAGDRPVRPEGFAVEEHAPRQRHRLVELLVERGVEALQIHADVLQQLLAFGRERRRRVDGLGTAVANHQPAAVSELVALGVAAEVVVVVEHEHLRGRSGGLAVEVRRGEAAQAGADHDQVVDLAGVGGGGDLKGASVAPQIVRRLERADVAAAQPGQPRRIDGRGRDAWLRPAERGERRRSQCRASHRDADVVEEVASRDRAIHPEFTIRKNGHRSPPICRSIGRDEALRVDNLLFVM